MVSSKIVELKKLYNRKWFLQTIPYKLVSNIKITIENYLEKLLICNHRSPTNYTIENGFAQNCGAAQISR